jgi:hypothetical protein
MTGELRLLIGVDDTDSAEGRGTGFRARELGRLIAERSLGRCRGISRHQLLFDPRIPYTSHNSALCLDVDTHDDRTDDIRACCRDYLLANSAPGSDAGLCIVAWDDADDAVEAFGWRAKETIVTQAKAHDIARDRRILLEGLTGDHGGVIGALAATGLRRSERDGRFVWREGVRELNGVVTVQHLLATTGIDDVRNLEGAPVSVDQAINVEPWPRPVLIDGQAVLLVEQSEEADECYGWRLAPKHIVKQY